MMSRTLLLATLCLVLAASAASAAVARTTVRFVTVEGSFDVELFDDLMPRTVANFLVYVNGGRYDGSVVHRNSDLQVPVRDFVIQGGGFFLNDPIPPADVLSFGNVVNDPPILDEPGMGVAGPSNVRGTIAMAKSGPDTVTGQWFINQGDNSFLDDPMRADGGFAAFGMVLGNGMDVVDAIGDLPIPADFGFSIGSPFNDLPLRGFSGSTIQEVREVHTVVVQSVSVVPEPGAGALGAASVLFVFGLGAAAAPALIHRPLMRPLSGSATGASAQAFCLSPLPFFLRLPLPFLSFFFRFASGFELPGFTWAGSAAAAGSSAADARDAKSKSRASLRRAFFVLRSRAAMSASSRATSGGKWPPISVVRERAGGGRRFSHSSHSSVMRAPLAPASARRAWNYMSIAPWRTAVC